MSDQNNDRKLANLDFLNREAQLYHSARNDIKTNSNQIQEAIEQNTKREVEEVNNAIKNLNMKVEKIMETDFIKARESNIKKSEEIIRKSVKLAMETFKKVCKVIDDKESLSLEQKKEYRKKLYEKIIDKFMTKEEKELFEKLMSGNIIFMGGGNNGLNMRSLGL